MTRLSAESDQHTRGRLQGLTQIVRFNWPMYATALAATIVAAVVLAFMPLPFVIRFTIAAALAIGAYWAVASLVVSFWLYDASPLCRWAWVKGELNTAPASWLNLHCGFDESTPALRRLLPGTSGRALDIFDPTEMTEPSIARARRLADADAEPADYRHLPVEDGSVDAAFLMLSAHELRSDTARRALFVDLHRALRPDGTVIVAEHLRDAANFAAFGPGFTHFHSRRTWLRTFVGSGWVVERERPITPFIAVFVLRRPR